MKKGKIFLILGVLVILLTAIVIITFLIMSKSIDNNTGNTLGLPVIKLNNKQDINQLEKYSVNGNDDYFMITKNVKWEVPNHPEGASVSFLISIPYTFFVNGNEYSGEYALGSGNYKLVDDNNPKYNLQITNLTKDGTTQVLIRRK